MTKRATLVDYLEELAQKGVFLQLRDKKERSLKEGNIRYIGGIGDVDIWPSSKGVMLIAHMFPGKLLEGIVEMNNDPDGKPGLYIRCGDSPGTAREYLIHRNPPGRLELFGLGTDEVSIEVYNKYANEWFNKHKNEH